ncbi:hypothetical protein LBMAG49_06310 [Planctomycetota bacterium]|nr:hypothetical protein LBMAG49_06310 [Planctomycetota bacterium]
MIRKQVRRDSRRIDTSMEEALSALESGKSVLAMRLARRARENDGANVEILLGHARVARACGQDEEAEESLRAAIAMSGKCKEAHVLLAELQAAHGKWVQAVRLMMRAIELDPSDLAVSEQLRSWHELLPQAVRDVVPPIEDSFLPPSPRVLGRNAEELHQELIERGYIVLRDVCTEQECAALRDAFASGEGFDRVASVQGGDGPACRERWSLLELPALVAELRRSMYPFAADLVGRTCALLGDKKPLPLTIGGWQRHLGGSRRPAGRFLAFTGNETLPTQRTENRAAFSLRLWIDLGPGPRTDSLRLIDARPGRKVRSTAARTAPGDALLFCCRDRPQQVGGVFGLQLVHWSCGPFGFERVLLDVPFDDV